MSLEHIAKNIAQLYIVVIRNPTWNFLIAFNSKSKGLNGYTAREMANLFPFPPDNIIFEAGFALLVTEYCERRIDYGLSR